MESSSYTLNAALIGGSFVLFAIIHSLTAGHAFRDWLGDRLGGRLVHGWYRLSYNVFSAITILAPAGLVAFLPDMVLYRVRMPWVVVLVLLQLAGAVGILIALLSTGVLEFAGVVQVARLLGNGPEDEQKSSPRLQTGGVYRVVRHPLYLFGMMVIWALPVMTYNLLVFNVSSTLYFAIGSWIEEKRLERQFGEDYRAYRRRVPWLIPAPWRMISSVSPEKQQGVGE